MIDTVKTLPPIALYHLLSMARVAPVDTVTLEMVTVICPTAGLAAAMPLMLMFSVMLPCTTTFRKATLVHDMFMAASAVGSVWLTVEQAGRIPPTAAWTNNITASAASTAASQPKHLDIPLSPHYYYYFPRIKKNIC